MTSTTCHTQFTVVDAATRFVAVWTCHFFFIVLFPILFHLFMFWFYSKHVELGWNIWTLNPLIRIIQKDRLILTKYKPNKNNYTIICKSTISSFRNYASIGRQPLSNIAWANIKLFAQNCSCVCNILFLYLNEKYNVW